MVRPSRLSTEARSVAVGKIASRVFGSPPGFDRVTDSYRLRRTILEALVVDAAVEAGVEPIDRFAVSICGWSDGRVTGLRGHRRGLDP
jgi:flavin-dependent dehydrogenase